MGRQATLISTQPTRQASGAIGHALRALRKPMRSRSHALRASRELVRAAYQLAGARRKAAHAACHLADARGDLAGARGQAVGAGLQLAHAVAQLAEPGHELRRVRRLDAHGERHGGEADAAHRETAHLGLNLERAVLARHARKRDLRVRAGEGDLPVLGRHIPHLVRHERNRDLQQVVVEERRVDRRVLLRGNEDGQLAARTAQIGRVHALAVKLVLHRHVPRQRRRAQVALIA